LPLLLQKPGANRSRNSQAVIQVCAQLSKAGRGEGCGRKERRCFVLRRLSFVKCKQVWRRGLSPRLKLGSVPSLSPAAHEKNTNEKQGEVLFHGLGLESILTGGLRAGRTRINQWPHYYSSGWLQFGCFDRFDNPATPLCVLDLWPRLQR
jgi:hypothetical protein